MQHATPVVKYQWTDSITALFYVVNVSNILLRFVDAFDNLTDKITHFISNVCLSVYSVKFNCQDCAKLLLEYFNWGYLVHMVYDSCMLYTSVLVWKVEYVYVCERVNLLPINSYILPTYVITYSESAWSQERFGI